MSRDPTLAWLLAPLPVEHFLDEIWGSRQHLVRRDDADYFAGLFDAAAVEQFLEYTRPDPQGIRLVRGADKKDLQSCRLSSGAIDMVAVRNHFAAGYTIVLNGLERYIPAIATLAHAIEVDLNFEVQVNAYVTPPKSQGFLPHYDDHDVLILQIQGTKTWLIHDAEPDVRPRELRLRETFVGEGLAPPSELTLRAGDLLYLPRGRIHAARAQEEASIHLTVGIHPPTVLALVAQALETLALRDDRVLERLPPRFLNDPVRRSRIAGLARDLIGAIDDRAIGDAVGALEDGLLRRGRCRPVGRFVADVTGADRVTTASEVVKCQPLYSRVMALDGGVGLQFAQTMVTADAGYRDAMLFLSQSRAPFRVGDLPGLTAAQQAELARRLIVDGFLIHLSANQGSHVEHVRNATPRVPSRVAS